MSYLHLPSFNIGDSPKGTISLWFRVSDDSVQKAKKHGQNYPVDNTKFEMFRGTIPLITFGRHQTGTRWGLEYHLDCAAPGYGTNPPQQSQGQHPVDPGPSPVEPSHIGLSCWQYGAAKDPPRLRLFFRTANKPTAEGLFMERVACHYSAEFQFFTYVRYDVFAEASYIYTDEPAAFLIEPNFEIEKDKWHHVLASWDFSTAVDTMAIASPSPGFGFPPGAAITGACKFYYAFDDENKNGPVNISGEAAEAGGGSWACKGPNDVVPIGAFLADFSYTPTPPPTDPLGNPIHTGDSAIAQWHYAASPLPLDSGPVGTPAEQAYVPNIYHVEMAELQLFIGLTVDTGNEKIRRAFVTKDGLPVDPEDTEKFFGRRPDILLHGTSDWQDGKNTGRLGTTIDTDGNELTIIASGQFNHVGRIDPFEPDPSLEESTA